MPTDVFAIAIGIPDVSALATGKRRNSTVIGRQMLILVATLGLVAAVLSAGLLPLNSTARALPTAGTDILNVSGSTSIVSVLGSETIPLAGTVTITRSDPVIDGGVEVVDTEIVAMDLTGTSVTGPITVVESATFVSSGEIRSLQAPPDDFPASSFFDAFIEVAVPGSPSDPLILHNEEPFRLVPTSGGNEVPLTAWPPTGVTYQADPDPCVPLLPLLPAQVCVTSFSILVGEVKPTPTNTPTPSITPTATVTPTPCPTAKVPTNGGCGTPTPTPTHTLTPIPTQTPTPCPTGKVPADGGCGTPTATPTTMPTPIPPPNDDFADSELVTALPSTDHGDTTSATLEPGEPQPCAGINRTVWYSFTPSTDVTLVADTVGSTYDTALAVYTGTSLETLSTIVCNDDGGPGVLSSVQFSATAGVTYYFQLGGFLGSSGHLDFNLALLIATPAPTPTVTPTPCPTGKVPSVTGCGTPTLTPTPTPTPITDLVIFPDNLPAPLPIPDAPAAGVSDTIVVTEPRTIEDLAVTLDITHTWVGDLIVTLTHEETGTSATLINRPGVPASTFGCSGHDIDATLDDEASLPAEDECAGGMPTISGSFTPDSPLSVFDGESAAGTWTLRISDNAGTDTGSLNGWSLMAALSDATPTATPTVTPTKQPPPGDTDGDGCTDAQENGPNEALGGQRDYLSFWDFFDVPVGGLPRDRAVNAFDIGAVVLRFGAFVDTPPTKEEALAEALTPPADSTSYHAAYDRGGPIPGENLWNLLPPNGAIDAFDIGAVVVQFGHTCA